jgi:hypothetical protein
MKFAKLLLLVAFSFMSIGLHAMARADEGTGYGYGYGCQAPYSRPDGTVGCGDEEKPLSPPDAVDCAYTTSGASVCSGEPEIIYEPTPDPEFGWKDHAIQAIKDGLPPALDNLGAGPVGAAGSFLGGAARGCLKCH